MRKFKIFTIIFTLSLTIISCDRNENLIGENGIVELYEIEQYETINNTDQIDESTVFIKKNPLLKYEDLLFYNSKEFMFKISESGKMLFENDAVTSGAFAVVANGELIYTGYFVPGYSSRLWFWNIIDPLMIGYNGNCHVRRIVVQGGNQPFYKDKRNDQRILNIFRNDGKLIE